MLLHYGHRDKITLIHHPTTRRHAQPVSYLLGGPGRGRQASGVDSRFGGDILSHSHQLLPFKVHHTTVTGNSLGAIADKLADGQLAWEKKRPYGEKQPLSLHQMDKTHPLGTDNQSSQS